jgi:hypothetical protein
MVALISTVFFQCDRCRVECRIDSEALEPSTAPLIIHHCLDSEAIPIHGQMTRFQERRGGVWVDVEGWIHAA